MIRFLKIRRRHTRPVSVAAALLRYHSLKVSHDTTYDFQESEVNELGYHLLGMGKTGEAIDILKLNAEEFPTSSNVYDGLGEAYMRHGDKELAIRNYRKSLDLDPDNTNAVGMLKRLNEK
jgi:Flp pilus assembly protein TadD